MSLKSKKSKAEELLDTLERGEIYKKVLEETGINQSKFEKICDEYRNLIGTKKWFVFLKLLKQTLDKDSLEKYAKHKPTLKDMLKMKEMFEEEFGFDERLLKEFLAEFTYKVSVEMAKKKGMILYKQSEGQPEESRIAWENTLKEVKLKKEEKAKVEKEKEAKIQKELKKEIEETILTSKIKNAQYKKAIQRNMLIALWSLIEEANKEAEREFNA